MLEYVNVLVVGAAVVLLAENFLKLNSFERIITTMSASLDALTASVGNLETAVDATVAEIASLKAGGDTAALPALQARIDAAAAKLAGA